MWKAGCSRLVVLLLRPGRPLLSDGRSSASVSARAVSSTTSPSLLPLLPRLSTLSVQLLTRSAGAAAGLRRCVLPKRFWYRQVISLNEGRRGFWRVLLPTAPGAAWAFSFGTKTASMDAIKRCDEFYEAGKMEAGLDAILAVKDDPNPEVQWRIARMNFKVAERSENASEKTKAIEEGVKLLRSNLEKAPKCPNTHKWIAVLLGSKDKHNTFKEQIEEAFIIREHLTKALEYNPNDGYAHYILGKWCFQVASVSWYQKKIAATLFASPPEATYQEALIHFKDAARLKPDIFNMCYLMTAKCLLEMGDKMEAGKSLQKCVEQENRDNDARKAAEEARKLAKKNGIAL